MPYELPTEVSWSFAFLVLLAGALISLILNRVLIRSWRRFHGPGPEVPSFMPEVGFMTLAVFIALTLAGPLIAAGARQFLEQDTPPSLDTNVWITVMINSSVVLLSYAMAKGRFGATASAFGFQRPTPAVFPMALLLLAAGAPLYLGVNVLNEKFLSAFDLERNQALVQALQQDEGLRTNPWLLVLIIGIVPILEEFIFRGAIQRSLKALLGPVVAILATSLMFAIIHDVQSTLPIFVVGMALGAIAEVTGSTWACAFAHSAFNAGMILRILSTSAG